MRSSRGGYLMAMLAGLAIVGASTGGVLAATSHHEASLAAAADPPGVAESSAAPSPAASTASIQGAGDPSGSVGSAPPASAAPAATAPASAAPAATAPAATAPAATAAGPSQSGALTSAPVTPSNSGKAVAPRTTAPRTTTPAPAPAHKFKDGQYSATVSYNSPGGMEKLGVTVTLAADKVVKSELDLLGGAGLSHSFQSAFASGYLSQVIGKDITTISLGAVSGSSLTGGGFNAALKEIESKARA